MLRSHVIKAVFKRNVLSYFSGILGYLFIVVFVVAAAAAAFSPLFFTNNLANLDQLTAYYPLLLLFIVPAITMGAWSEEKKLGTDELLFTLPATDFEILIGKYLSVLAVYTVALFFSLTQLGVLAYYADPDWGLLFTTYFGYWLAGASLLSAGMLASVLTSSMTVAFVLGAVICSVPVFVGKVDPANSFFQQLSLSEQLREFGMGLVPFSGLLYFVSFAVFMLYLNAVVISRRHWSSQGESLPLGLQFAIRATSLVLALISLNVVVGKAGEVLPLRFDMTAEELYTLTDTTEDLLANIDKDCPVTIQAFLTAEVPRELVVQQKQLTGLLRQYDRMGGNRIEVRLVYVEPFSKEAEEARHFGIAPQRVHTEQSGRYQQQDVFLGAVVTSPFDEVTVPFFQAGTPIEYELTRSIRTVSQADRLTVGILRTDAKVQGGFDMSTFRSTPPWRIKDELSKQYNVEEVSPDGEIDREKFDVLIAILPSSLTEPQMANLVDYVRTGRPVLIFADPLPSYSGGQDAPRMPKPKPGGMFGQQGPPPEQKADGGRATSLLNALEISWDNGQVAWDLFNPHPQFVDLPPEFIFISPKSGTKSAFSPDSPITSGMQEMLAFFPGTIRPRPGSRLKFEALLRTGTRSGLHDWSNITQPSMFGGMTIAQDPPRFLDDEAHVLAARVTSTDDKEGEGINVIFVADIDLISNQLFDIAQRQIADLKLDNVKFVLNAVDVLAGDESYVDLRKRRAKHRALTVIQNRTDAFREDRAKKQEEAENEAKEQLEQRRESLKKMVEAIESDATMSRSEKEQKKRIAQQTEQRRLEVAEANIERSKKDKLESIKADEQQQVRALENRIRRWVVFLPPLPAVLLGLLILGLRLSSERREIEPSRLIRK